MEQLRVDAFSPAEIAKKISEVARKKSSLDLFRLFVLAVMAGAFIGLGAQFFNLAIHDSAMSVGMTKLVGGVVFSLGLILIVLAGAELFTGNTLMVMGFIERVINGKQLLRSWTIVYIGNFVGSLFIVLLIYYSDQWAGNGAMVGAKALLIASGKVNLDFFTAFVRGILCNILVVLAVWLCFGARTTVDKILAIVFPITAFVASGFEHSIANMYFIPMGMLLQNQPAVVAAAESMSGGSLALQNLTWYGFLVRNLLPVTLGNIVGGSFLVGIAYWSVFLREFSFRGVFQLAALGFRLLFLFDPRDLSPSRVRNTLSGFYGAPRKMRPGRRPLPRDLTQIHAELENEQEDQT
jgi:formate/nitrite transporter